MVHEGDVLIGALVVPDVVFLVIEYVFVGRVPEAVDVEFVEVAVLCSFEELNLIQEVSVLIGGEGVTHLF